jgi:sugar lactone lactonase YvrE
MIRPGGRPVLGIIVAVLSACTGGDASPSEAGDPSGLPAPPSAATSADGAIDPLSCPDGLAVDRSGTLYAADVCTNRVLRFTPGEGWTSCAATGRGV